jgi:hypothetical protein
MEKETFKIEITMVEGQIVDINPLQEDLKKSKTVPSLNQFPEDEKKEIMESMQHGSMLLMGQNSPGWVVIKTAHGYTRVWR